MKDLGCGSKPVKADDARLGFRALGFRVCGVFSDAPKKIAIELIGRLIASSSGTTTWAHHVLLACCTKHYGT